MYSSYYSSYPTSTVSSADADAIGAVLGFGVFFWVLFWIIFLAATIITCIARWKVFKKANIDGWEALIPVHSDIVELQLGGVKTYWYFLTFVVLCGIGPLVVQFWKSIALAKAFGKGTGFGVVLALFPFIGYPLLAWKDAEYIGVPEKN